MRRFREFETRAFQPENLDDWNNNGLMALIQRSMASAERSFHKSLAALQKVQKCTGRESVVRDQEKVRGFVPQKHVEKQTSPKETGFVPAELSENAAQKATPAGFLPQKTAAELEASEYMGYYPEDAEGHVELLLDSGNYLPDSLPKRP